MNWLDIPFQAFKCLRFMSFFHGKFKNWSGESTVRGGNTLTPSKCTRCNVFPNVLKRLEHLIKMDNGAI